MDKAQQYLCLARKAGFLSVGEENCSAVTESGRARLLLLAGDTAPNTARRAENSLAGHRAPLMTLPWTKAELSALLGKAGCSVVCFTDLALAGRFASAMAEELPEWQETAELLARRADKARKRKAAPRKHENRRK
ncbi:MAG: hypothetical protein IJT62_03255 [Oscillospiraceae bacterium]|nr:hypothetical protein [Oscillospiraceae bacterium]